MTKTPTVRESAPTEDAAILDLYPQMFPDEDLRPVVTALMAEPAGVLSLVAEGPDGLVGHVVFTDVGTSGGPGSGALLGPLGVLPGQQGAGLGTALVRDGFARLAERGVAQVFVLGDPGYYGRFGFAAETRVQPPYPLPEAYGIGPWQSLCLAGRAPLPDGTLAVPAPWRDPALW